MIDFIFWSYISFVLFDNLFIIFRKYNFGNRDIGNYLSIIHAVPVIILHTYFVFYYNIHNLVGWYNLSYGLTLGYGIIDLINIFTFVDNFNYALTMILHHVLLITSMFYGFYITNFFDPEKSYYLSLGLLSEISTPLLNYIQIKKGNVALWLKYLFVFVYFLCRPINLSYLTYYTYFNIGPLNPITIIAYMITSLNYYWFYRIWLKTIMVEQEYNDAIKLLKSDIKDNNQKLIDKL